MSGVTVPMVVEGERIFVDGTVNGKPIRYWVDTGGGALRFAESVGLEQGERSEEEGHTFAETPAPIVAIDGYQLDTSEALPLIDVGLTNLLSEVSPGHAEGFIPSRVLARHHVIFDYPGRTMSIDSGGNNGTQLPMTLGEHSRFPRIELEIDGETYGFLLDTGASMTMVSEALRARWFEGNPDWQHWTGAIGDATHFGGRVIETFIVPEVQWGDFAINEMMSVSQPEGTFENWMSSAMAAPIVGALGGNVLRHFKITIDYPNELLFVERG